MNYVLVRIGIMWYVVASKFVLNAVFLLRPTVAIRCQRRSQLLLSYCTTTTSLFSKKLDIRPTIDDIERISRGQATSRRGTGSRGVPHRLNAAERVEWDLAKKRRFLMLRGTGWRRERGDSPLSNIYRNYCDAVAVPCISVVRALGSSAAPTDHVIVDFSPLRRTDILDMVSTCKTIAQDYPSVQALQDHSTLIESWEEMLHSEPIYRLPVCSLVVSFAVRAEARKYAEQVATTLANGVKQVVDISVDEEIERHGEFS